jgi:AcrR family transcriptional regulator
VTPRTGRRPGSSGTRDAILDSARRLFGEVGYNAASIRRVAQEAGVDPALVHHYFGTKEKLFVAAMDMPVNPAEIVGPLLDGDRDHIGERLLRTFLSVWDSESMRAPMLAMIRSAVQHEQAAAMVREFVEGVIVARVIEKLDVDDEQWRASLVSTHVLGLIVGRYIIKVEPLASADPEKVIAAIAPTVQRYLTGDLEESASGREVP